MKKRRLASVILVLMLLTGCASKTPLEPAAEPVPETPVLEAREAYQLAEIPVQELHDGDEVTVDGVCTFTVKGFGAGKTITADGSTCAGSKVGQTLVWVTCDYVNLTQDELSPGRLVENAVLRLESGSSDGKSASFAQILPGEPAAMSFPPTAPEHSPQRFRSRKKNRSRNPSRYRSRPNRSTRHSKSIQMRRSPNRRQPHLPSRRKRLTKDQQKRLRQQRKNCPDE